MRACGNGRRRERLFLFLEEPGAGTANFLFGLSMWVLLLLSAATTTLETLAFWHSWVGTRAFLYAKMGLNVVFTLEAALRVVSYIPFRRAWRSPILWLDVLTVVPFWVPFEQLSNVVPLFFRERTNFRN